MVCCAVRKDQPAVAGEAVVRTGYRLGLWTLQGACTLATPLWRDSALWREFAAMLREDEARERPCPGPAAPSEDLLHLRRAFTGRLMRYSPALAGRAHRWSTAAPPHPALDLTAAALMGTLRHVRKV